VPELDLAKIESIALRVRLRYEAIAETDNYPDDLCGLCARATAFLIDTLQVENIPAVAVESKTANHFYAEIAGILVVDVTATQFSSAYPTVLMESPTQALLRSKVYTPGLRFTTAAAIANYFQESGWDISSGPILHLDYAILAEILH